MLAIGAGFTGKNLAERMVEVFLSTDFEGGRHERRVNKLNAIQPDGQGQSPGEEVTDMGGTKGYRSYRGRTSKGKIALAVLLVLIILAAVGFLWLQEYIVYDRDGSFHLELPWKTETPPAEEEVPPEDVEITIQEPEKPKALAAFSASAAPLTQAGWKDAWLGASVMSAPAYNAAAVTLKDSTGHIYFAATGAAAGTVSTAEDTAAALAEVTESVTTPSPG